MKTFFSRSALLVIVALSLLAACTSEEKSTDVSIVHVNSLADLNALFEKSQYNEDNWNSAGRTIPRITFKSIGEKWVASSPNLPVNTKKTTFFRLMLPLVLLANENILQERKVVESAQHDDKTLLAIARKYKVIKDEQMLLTDEMRQTLLSRVDILPPSLALSQAAEESGWGTSRFALEGNAFFGQWDFSGKGMKPKQHREALGNYGVARFDSPLQSVEAYMLNLNTNNAYHKLRLLRTEARRENKPITGVVLATTLEHYSERGDAYVEGIRDMIEYNRLASTDSLQLSETLPILLISGSE